MANGGRAHIRITDVKKVAALYEGYLFELARGMNENAIAMDNGAEVATTLPTTIKQLPLDTQAVVSAQVTARHVRYLTE